LNLYIDKNPEILFVEYLTSSGRSIIIINPFSVYIDVMQYTSLVFQTSDLIAAIFRLNVVEIMVKYMQVSDGEFLD